MAEPRTEVSGRRMLPGGYASIPATTTKSLHDFKPPPGVVLDPGKIEQYQQLLGRHQVPKAAHQPLLDLHIAEAQRMAKDYADEHMRQWNTHLGNLVSAFHADPEIGGNRSATSLGRAQDVLERYGQSKGGKAKSALVDAMSQGGLAHHPETVRFLNWVSEHGARGASAAVARQTQAPNATATRSGRRYGNSMGRLVDFVTSLFGAGRRTVEA